MSERAAAAAAHKGGESGGGRSGPAQPDSGRRDAPAPPLRAPSFPLLTRFESFAQGASAVRAGAPAMGAARARRG